MRLNGYYIVRILLTALLLLILAPGLMAAPHRIKLQDPAGNPIEGALIISGKANARSDKEGFFSIEVADSLHISRLGYHSLSLPKIGLSASITMQPKPVELHPYRVFARTSDPFTGAADLVRVAFDPERHYSTAAEILDDTAAIQSQGTALKGEVAELSILGNLSRHTLVVVDGVPMNPLGDPYDLGKLDPANIASVEIIKNNASAYGGAAAIGGIVMITTRKFMPTSSFSSQTELGSFGYLMQNLNLNAVTDDANYSLGISGFRAENDFPLSDAEQLQAPGDSIRINNRKADFKLNMALQKQYGIIGMGISGDFSTFRRELPGNLNFLELYRKAYLKGSSWHPQFYLNAGTGKLKGKTTLWINGDRTTYDNTLAPLGAMHSKYRQELFSYGARQELGFHYDWLLANLHAETIQQEYAYHDLYHNQAGGIDTLSTQYSYGGSLQVAVDPFYWLQLRSSVAGRMDQFDAQNHSSGRVELSFRNPGENFLEVGGTYGSSFAVPSPYDLFWKGDSQAMGNPDLKSETSEGMQAWLQGNLSWVGAKATLHRNRIKNLIQWRQVMNDTAWKPMNVGKAEIRNMELEAWLMPFRLFEARGSALFTEAKDVSSLAFEEAPYLIYRPELVYNVNVGINAGPVKLWGKYSHTGKQWITVDNLLDPQPAYELVDVGISYKHRTGDWELIPYFSVSNLQDKDYQVHQYVPEPGRSYFGGIKLKQHD